MSPTTPQGSRTTTTWFGSIDPPFDICRIAEAAGASFVARTTAYHVLEMDRLITRAIRKNGFSVVEAISQCPVYFGRHNNTPSPVEMLRWQRDNTVLASAGEDSASGKIVRGLLVDRDQPEYSEEYFKLVERLKASEGTQ